MPESMTVLRRGCFRGCGNLENIYFHAAAPALADNFWHSAFGGAHTIYHRPGTKGWGKTFAGRLTAVWVPEAGGMATNLPCPAFVAAEAEQKGDWEAALLEYETRYDSKGTDEFLRSTLRTKFRELRPKVTPNRDPAQAGTWKVKAYAIRQLDFHWADADKQARHAQWKMADAEIEAIRASLTAFAERVWELTAGNLRIDWTLEMIDTPLNRLDGDANAGFWPGSGVCMPLLTAFKAGDADTVMVYAKLQGGSDEPGTAVPIRFAGWASGITGATRGATYAGFALGGEGDQVAPGERELRQWLHNVKWTLEEFQAYPHGLMHAPDGGRDEGERGGDYCYRRKPGEKGWMGYYRHLMQEHVTRKMWRELSLRKTTDNVWIKQFAQQALLLGFFPAPDKPGWGIDEPFIDEANLAVPKAGEKVGEWEWKAIRVHLSDHPSIATKKSFEIEKAIEASGVGVSYLAIRVVADAERDIRIALGADDHCRVFLNGRFVIEEQEGGGIWPDQHSAEARLAKGQNLFLLKVVNGGGPTGAAFRLTAPDGGPLEGVRYVVE